MSTVVIVDDDAALRKALATAPTSVTSRPKQPTAQRPLRGWCGGGPMPCCLTCACRGWTGSRCSAASGRARGRRLWRC